MRSSGLLFHGTTAISVWTSFRQGQALQNLSRDKKKIAGDYFKQHGPLYPKINHHDQFRSSGPNLVSRLSDARGFAASWESIPSENIAGERLRFENNLGRKLNYFLLELEILEPKTEDVTRIISQLSLKKELFSPPGAILIINEQYLRDHDLLLLPKGEETFRTRCLPWKAIDAVLLGWGQGEDCVFSSYLAKNVEVLHRIANHLRSPEINWDPKYYFPALVPFDTKTS